MAVRTSLNQIEKFANSVHQTIICGGTALAQYVLSVLLKDLVQKSRQKPEFGVPQIDGSGILRTGHNPCCFFGRIIPEVLQSVMVRIVGEVLFARRAFWGALIIPIIIAFDESKQLLESGTSDLGSGEKNQLVLFHDNGRRVPLVRYPFFGVDKIIFLDPRFFTSERKLSVSIIHQQRVSRVTTCSNRQPKH